MATYPIPAGLPVTPKESARVLPTTEEALAAQARERQIAERVRSFYRDYDAGFLTWEEFKDAVDLDIHTLLP